MIEAYVVDAATNAGVNLATIKLFKYVGGIWDDLGKTTLSNGSGYFAFSDVNPGLYRVTISKSDYVDRDFAITIREDGTKDPAMPKIILTPVAQAVVGNVVGTVKLDTTGQVLPEIYVSLKNSSNAHVTGSPLKTTADGKFGFYGLVPGTYTLNASGTSFTSVTRTCYILSNGTTDPSSTILTLSRDPATGNIIGYVKYGTTPLPEISVRILDSTDTPLASSPFITTQDGKFAANDLGAGVYTISIDDPKYAPATRTVYIASNGTVDPATTNISLTKVTGTLSGYVRNSSTNAALAEVWVSVKGSDGQNAASPMLTTAEGRYYFSNLLPDTYTLNASAPGYLTATRTVYIREDGTTDPTTTTLFITPDPSVVGTIVGYVRLASTSAALPEIDVKLYKGLVQVGNDIRTTSEGKFLFENLQPDTYTITVPGTVSGGPGQTYYEVTRTCYIRSNGTSDPTQTTIPLVDKP
ncbi:MAG: Cna protein B-type domain protein [bacterium ADurb.Bin374]|nr:MAG: Cna protein B-type domain protein [bacterium ADurb.Bin374]